MCNKSISSIEVGKVDNQPDGSAGLTPISDDQELAKALAGIAADEPVAEMVTPVTPAAPAPFPVAEVAEPVAVDPILAAAATMTPAAAPVAATTGTTSGSADLDAIKQTALNELRPLLDHVELPVEEKFDTYLMLIRSTDDTSLIGPAHIAAQSITDDKRRAEALLDIVKEIDFLSHKEG